MIRTILLDNQLPVQKCCCLKSDCTDDDILLSKFQTIEQLFACSQTNIDKSFDVSFSKGRTYTSFTSLTTAAFNNEIKGLKSFDKDILPNYQFPN